MVFLAAAEILTIFTGIILLIWRLQFIFPEFGFILLGILVLTLLVHRDGWRNLGFGSHGFVSGMKALFAPTMILSMGFVLGSSGAIFAAFHIPNPVLMPLTFFGGVILTRVFIRHRNLVLRLINSFTIVASAMAPDSRSDEGAMLIHCDRGATTKTGPFRRNPSGRWGLRAISSSRFVGDERASPSSSLLDLASQAPSAMVKLFMKRNTSAARAGAGGNWNPDFNNDSTMLASWTACRTWLLPIIYSRSLADEGRLPASPFPARCYSCCLKLRPSDTRQFAQSA